MIAILSYVVGLVTLVCWIMVLIKCFQAGKILHGILGIVTCGLWAIAWGWLNVKEQNIKTLMIVYTASWIIGIVLNFMQFNAAGGLTPVTP